MKTSDVYAWCGNCDTRVDLDGDVAVAVNAHDELVAALEAIYATAIEPDATFSEGAFRDAILNSRALLARIKGESNEND